MKKDEIDKELLEVTRRVNERIRVESPNWHPMEFRARAEMIAAEDVPSGWSWGITEYHGDAPTITLLSFDPRLAKR